MPNTLQDIIKTKLDQKGWSYNDLARRGGISRSTVHHLATSPHLAQIPQHTTLEGLARGLGIPLAPLTRAAAQAAGIPLHPETTPHTTDPDMDILIAAVHQLAPTDRRHVTALVESLLHTHNTT
ncbi:helix-turn-helix transcriptional regulator [Streptomyces sp. NPDC048664]|uniref:helix-turn-helix domain-containing protein n=1 Tax=Streptomyces sp. NPDC048664 TaxID=3154505 RepID=UPI00341BF739